MTVNSDRGHLVEPFHQRLLEAGLDLARPTRVSVRERDIDGCTVIVDLDASRPLDWEQIAPVADAVVKAVGEEMAAPLQRERHERSNTLSTRTSAPPATALWTHTIIRCPGSDASVPHRCDEERARALLPTSFVTVDQRTGTSFLAFHATLICSADEGAANRLVELVDELHAWWSASWILDQDLLETSLQMSRRMASPVIPDVLRAADVLASTTSEVGTIRARLDTYRLSLGGLEWPVWDAASRKWELEDNLIALERKRQLLQDMTTSFREIVESHRSARLNQAAAFFAVMSSLASFVAVVVFLFPALAASDGHTLLRWMVAVSALFLTLAGVLWSSRYMLRLARRRSEPPTRYWVERGSE